MNLNKLLLCQRYSTLTVSDSSLALRTRAHIAPADQEIAAKSILGFHPSKLRFAVHFTLYWLNTLPQEVYKHIVYSYVLTVMA